MFKQILQYARILPSDDEVKIINALIKNGSASMKVIGRGTLIMDPKDVIKSEKYQELLSKSDQIIGK